MLRILAAATLLAGAGTGEAAVIINQSAVGTAISVDYAGTVLGLANSGLSAIGSFVYTGATNGGKTYNFSYSLTNDSTITSKLRSFGFDVLGDAAVTSLASTGTFNTQISNPLSGLAGTDVCFAVAATLGTCATGSGGLTAGQLGTGSFALTFANVMSSVQLDAFAVSYQGVNGLLAGSGMGDATSIAPVSAAPEPATWAMMILGLGLVGWLMRRRGTMPLPALAR